jgi:hypothetical protein
LKTSLNYEIFNFLNPNKMSSASSLQMGNDSRPNVLPTKEASGPGFLGPDYNPADEMLPPAAIGVRRGGDLNDVLGAVKGVIYYGDMIGFGQPSSSFTSGMPGLTPLGVNYFVNSGLTCSNGATMWEYVETIPTGGALGSKVKDAMASMGLPQLRGMAPGMIEDTQSALNPFPVINAVVGSGYPQCSLVKKPIGNPDGQIYNVDGVLLVDPEGLIQEGGRYYQERWVQEKKNSGRKRPGESDSSYAARAEPIQLSYDAWDSAPKTHGDNGCIKDRDANPSLPEPAFCKNVPKKQGFVNYRSSSERLVSFSVAIFSLLGLVAFWTIKPGK